jgi:hypothetical protein
LVLKQPEKVCEIDSIINISTTKWLSNKKESLKVNGGEVSEKLFLV